MKKIAALIACMPAAAAAHGGHGALAYHQHSEFTAPLIVAAVVIAAAVAVFYPKG